MAKAIVRWARSTLRGSLDPRSVDRGGGQVFDPKRDYAYTRKPAGEVLQRAIDLEAGRGWRKSQLLRILHA